MCWARRSASSIVGLVVAASLSACGDPGGDPGRDPGRHDDAVELPFGLEQLDGTEPIGSPAVFEREYVRTCAD